MLDHHGMLDSGLWTGLWTGQWTEQLLCSQFLSGSSYRLPRLDWAIGPDTIPILYYTQWEKTEHCGVSVREPNLSKPYTRLSDFYLCVFSTCTYNQVWLPLKNRERVVCKVRARPRARLRIGSIMRRHVHGCMYIAKVYMCTENRATTSYFT